MKPSRYIVPEIVAIMREAEGEVPVVQLSCERDMSDAFTSGVQNTAEWTLRS